MSWCWWVEVRMAREDGSLIGPGDFSFLWDVLLLVIRFIKLENEKLYSPGKLTDGGLLTEVQYISQKWRRWIRAFVWIFFFLSFHAFVAENDLKL